MIPAPGVQVVEVDDVEVVDGSLSVFLLLSDGSLVGVCVPIDELISRGHTIIEAADAPAMREAPLLQ
jgi:hypothetical protein